MFCLIYFFLIFRFQNILLSNCKVSHYDHSNVMPSIHKEVTLTHPTCLSLVAKSAYPVMEPMFPGFLASFSRITDPATMSS